MTLEQVYDQMLADCTTPVECLTMHDDQMFEHMARCSSGTIATTLSMRDSRETLVTMLGLQDRLQVKGLTPCYFSPPTTLYVLDVDDLTTTSIAWPLSSEELAPGQFYKSRLASNDSIVRWKRLGETLIRVFDLVCLDRIFPTYETVIVSKRLLKNHDYFTRQLRL